MKKVLFTLAVVAGAASFTSCKKSYTCDCVATQEVIITEDGFPDEIMSSSNANYSYSEEMKSKESEAWCDSFGGTSSSDMMGLMTSVTTIECTLK